MADARVVLDSSAVIALFRGETFTTSVTRALTGSRGRMTTVNAAEVVDVLTRVYRWSRDDVVGKVDQFLAIAVDPVPASLDLAMKAGELRGHLYDRAASRLSLADCFCLAIAEPGDRVVTTDRTLASAARAEGYEVVAPD